MLIIGNGRVVTRDSANPYIESGAVAIEGTQIKKVGDLETLKKEFPDAEFIDTVEKLDDRLLSMGKGPKSKVGTGGMATKLTAAEIATSAGADMIIANGRDFHIIHKLIEGRKYGTLFAGNKKEEFYLIDYIEKLL